MTDSSLLLRLGGVRTGIESDRENYRIQREEMRSNLIRVIQAFQDLEVKLSSEGVKAKLSGGDFWDGDMEPPIEEIRHGELYSKLESMGGAVYLDVYERDSKTPDFCLVFDSEYCGFSYNDLSTELGPLTDHKKLNELIQGVIPNKFYFPRDAPMKKEKKFVLDDLTKDFLNCFVLPDAIKECFRNEHLFFPTEQSLLTYLGSEEIVNEIAVRTESKHGQVDNLIDNLDKILDYVKSIRPAIRRVYREVEGHLSLDCSGYSGLHYYSLTISGITGCVAALKEVDPNFSLLSSYKFNEEIKDSLEEHFIDKFRRTLIRAAEAEKKMRAKIRLERG